MAYGCCATKAALIPDSSPLASTFMMDAVIGIPAAPPRTKRRGRHHAKALSAAFVRSAPQGRHADGNGLYLFVQPTGTRSWIQRLVVRGRRRELGLGAATLVSLADAREQALANRKLARSGGDPLADKRRVQRVPTSPTPPGACSNRSEVAGAAGGTRRTGGGAWNATPSRVSAAGRSRRSTRPTCWRSCDQAGVRVSGADGRAVW